MSIAGGFAFGADWNPDQWPRAVWERDLELMNKIGVNLVTLPVFGWAQLQPAADRFELDWLADVLDATHRAGIRVDLATGTATPPPWLVRQYPEMLPVDARGTRLEYGSRQSYCPSSPVFRAHAVALAEAMAHRFGAHPALALWHVSNEYGDHVAECYCEVSAASFRRWLGERYTSIADLNDAWGTKAWGQVYTDLGQVEPPRSSMGPVNPGHLLDFRRFASDELRDLFAAEVDVLRRITPGVPVTTNFMGLLPSLDYWRFAELEDLVSNDAYPDPADPLSHVRVALSYGLMRSLRGRRPWLQLEQAPSAVSWREVNVPKWPGQNRAHALQAVAHGSDGALYFQWRKARYGAERFHSAILGDNDELSRTFVETAAVGADLRRICAVTGSVVRSSVAMIVDWDCRWALTAPESLPSVRLTWEGQAHAMYAALHGLGLAVDALPAGGDPGGYPMVIAPSLYLLSDQQAAGLIGYVQAGGMLVVGPFSGVVDRHDRRHLGGAPGPLRDLLGIRVEEPWPIAEPGTAQIEFADGRTEEPQMWTEWLDVVDPDLDVLASYTSRPLRGRPAITRRRVGRGWACYLSCDLSPAGMTQLMRELTTDAGIATRARAHPFVEVVTRTDGTTDYTFVINHGTEEAEIRRPPEATVLLGDVQDKEAPNMALRPFEVVVLSTPSTEVTHRHVHLIEVQP